MMVGAIEPRISLSDFAKYVAARQSSTKVSLVKDAYRRALRSRPFGPPYAPLINAIKRDAATGNRGVHIEAAVRQAKPSLQAHYVECAEGWRRFVMNLRFDGVVDVGTYHWQSNGLIVHTNGHFGLFDGRQLATTVVRLWCDKQPPPDEALAAMLHLLPRCDQAGAMPSLGAEATAAIVIDLRRGTAPTPNLKDGDDIENWLHNEAASFVSTWNELTSTQVDRP